MTSVASKRKSWCLHNDNGLNAVMVVEDVLKMCRPKAVFPSLLPKHISWWLFVDSHPYRGLHTKVLESIRLDFREELLFDLKRYKS